MKLKLSLCALIILLLPVLGHAGSTGYNVEFGDAGLVTRIDLNKRIIYMNGKELGYGSLTKFYDYRGNKTDISALKPGMMISYDVDAPGGKSALRLTASSINIKTKLAMPLLETKRR